MVKPTTSHYQCAGREVFRFVSGTAVLEEALHRGVYAGLYWSASNHVHRENFLATLFNNAAGSFQLEMDGQSLNNQWEFAGGTQTIEAEEHTLSVTTLKHALRPVTVRVCTRLDGTPFLARWLEITNTSGAPAALSRVVPYCGVLWQNDFKARDHFETTLSKHKSVAAPFSIAHIDALAGAEEFNLKWVDITQPGHVIANRTRKVYNSPYYIARNNISGETFRIALAWPGGFETRFAYDRLAKTLSFETGPCGGAPLRVLDPGETVVSPAVHIGPSHLGTDETTAEWLAHLRASVIPQRKGNKRMYTVAGRIIEERGDWILREIDIAHEMGAEAFMVDAGWYGEPFTYWYVNRGDWFEGTSFLPEGGIAGIREYCHKKGMLFGLWMEPEAISPETKIYKEHPEYASERDGAAEMFNPYEIRLHREMNLSIPGAAKYVSDSIKEVILGKKLDFFKMDYNIYLPEGLATARHGFMENNTWRHYEILLGIYKEVRRQNPDVALENCAGGGSRNDLAMMSVFDYCCDSDSSQMPLSIRRINAMTLFLPPEAIAYYHNHINYAHQLADIETHLRVTLFAIPVFVGFGAQNADRNSVYFKKTREYMELAKGFCRPVMENSPAVYHHTPYIGLAQPASFCVLEYGAQDKSRGYCGVFKLDHGRETHTLRLCGVDEGKTYEVTRKNSGAVFTASGLELANTGLNITLENINTSELILYKALD